MRMIYLGFKLTVHCTELSRMIHIYASLGECLQLLTHQTWKQAGRLRVTQHHTSDPRRALRSILWEPHWTRAGGLSHSFAIVLQATCPDCKGREAAPPGPTHRPNHQTSGLSHPEGTDSWQTLREQPCPLADSLPKPSLPAALVFRLTSVTGSWKLWHLS